MPAPTLATTEKCTGCAACMNRCPQQAISMELCGDGFYRPKVNTDICIGCGVCSKVCPVLKTQSQQEHTAKATCYTGWLTDEAKRLASSSGGAFTALAELVLASGGCVFGVELKPDMSAAHICVEKTEDLVKLRGSKYIPSTKGGIYRKVEAELSTGRKVLFTGTPCEIFGLFGYLRKNHDNLITCDIACHGVPSPLLFKRYLNYLKTQIGAPVSSLDFRNKESGWMSYSIRAYASSTNKSLSTVNWDDPYMQGFLSNACLKPACYSCRWHEPHRADITLADAWGIHRVRPEWDHSRGVSLMLAHTEKGRQALESAAAQGALFLHREEESAAAQLIHANEGLVHQPMPVPQRRKRFLQDLNSILPLPAVLDMHLTTTHPRKLRKDIAIIGLWMTCNYGAVLTDFALYRLLQDMGYDPILLDHSLASGGIARFMDPETPFRRFLKEQQIETTRPLNTGDDMEQLNDMADTFMVGSDQMWHIALWERPDLRPLVGYYMLDFVRPDKRKIAFASSFGTDNVSAGVETRQWEAALLHLFDSVSVREDSAAAILEQYYQVEAPVVLDPVFLCERSLFDRVADASTQKTEQDFICSYVLDNSPELRELENRLAGELGCRIIHLTDPEAGGNGDFLLNNLKAGMGIPEWLHYISHCRYLITDSYHGVCFAIIYNKPFSAVGNVKRGLTRFESLLRLCELSHRLVLPGMPHEPRKEENWEKVTGILDAHKVQSIKILNDALRSPRKLSTKQANDMAWQNRAKHKTQPPAAPNKCELRARWLHATIYGAGHALLAALHINTAHHRALRVHHGKLRRKIAQQLRG